MFTDYAVALHAGQDKDVTNTASICSHKARMGCNAD
ncbi:hypothetical protein P353_19155 [Comamonas testosteroni]|uniref:Uncharacterized protein n=1 Tax=Comamonas testosteroni TaxID=285 RepID=A0A096HE58_COMTE|nr:hypothetical protein P353_19155 [Comamonas testosteroni]